MKPIKLPFGLNENHRIVHIANVESGKKCNCVCPDCRSPLIASKGIKKQHHFKHAVVNECKGESAVHLAAKQIIRERKQITLSRYIVSASKRDSRGIEHTEQKTIVEDRKVIHFDSVQEEVELHGMRVDLSAKKDNKQLIIEVFYRHKVEDQKRVKIAENNISAIEIILCDLTTEDLKDWETLWSYINDPQRIRWVHNAKDRDDRPALQERLATKIQEQEAEIEEQKRAKQVPAASLNNLRGSQSKQYSEPGGRLLLLCRPSLRRGSPPIDRVRLFQGKLKGNQNQPFGRKKFSF